MSAELVIANLLRVAREDLDGARTLQVSGNRNAVYLCEQAAEKIIRAVLTSEGVHAGVKHDLDVLVAKIPDLNPIKPKLQAIEHLSAYATSYRYPTSSGRIPPPLVGPRLDDALRRTQSALDAAVAYFGVDLARQGAPARTCAPERSPPDSGTPAG